MRYLEHGIRRRTVKSLRQIKRIVVAVIGGTVILVGLALLVLPGPAFVVIPMGLAILATEFAWAKHWIGKAKRFFGKGVETVLGK
jgi:tellurite resistance protein TerC